MQVEEFSHTFTEETGGASRLNQWLFDTIQPYIKGRTMEMGSHHGAVSSLFTANELPLHLSDSLGENRHKLAERFKEEALIRLIHDMDFLRQDFAQAYEPSIGAFSTVIAINITENGYYSNIALNNAKYLLRLRGHLIIVAPVYTALFNGLDDDLDEWKKHNAPIVKKIMGDDVEVLKVRYFNWQPPAGIHSNTAGLSTLVVFRKTAS